MSFTHGTIYGYRKKRCRCEACRGAMRDGNRRDGRRAEQKRRWDSENRPLCECGQPMSRGATQCLTCRHAAEVEHQRIVEKMWAAGMTARQLADALGWETKHPNISTLRNRGYNLPHRRTPEQIARITADGGEHLRRARAALAAKKGA